MQKIQKYPQVPRLRTKESFWRYLEKWILLSAALGVLTGLVVALFDYATNFVLWSFFQNFYSSNYLLIFPLVLSALLCSGFLLNKSYPPIGSGTEEFIRSYNRERGRMHIASFPKNYSLP